MGKIRNFIYLFTHISTLVLLATAVYIAIFWGPIDIESKVLWQIPGVSFLCSFAGFIDVKDNASKKKAILMIVLRYLYVNVIVLPAGILLEWFYIDNLPMVIGMLIVIAVVYTLITILTYYKDKMMADKMTIKLIEKLKKTEERLDE